MYLQVIFVFVVLGTSIAQSLAISFVNFVVLVAIKIVLVVWNL